MPTAENYVRQGVTTMMRATTAVRLFRSVRFSTRWARRRIAVNFALLRGTGQHPPSGDRAGESQSHGSGNRQDARDHAGRRCWTALSALSTGLFYVPGNFTPTEEVIELAKVVGAMGGMHISHMRDEASHMLDSVRETIRIGEEGGLPTQITHHKIIGAANWGKSAESLRWWKRRGRAAWM